jgi:hypothetical protein
MLIDEIALRTIVREEMKSVLKEVGLHDEDAGSAAAYSNMFSSPVSVVGGFTDWSEVSGGYRHSLALRLTAT